MGTALTGISFSLTLDSHVSRRTCGRLISANQALNPFSEAIRDLARVSLSPLSLLSFLSFRESHRDAERMLRTTQKKKTSEEHHSAKKIFLA